jgi:1,4-dihydroxy-6-naphthoate synthase
MRTITLGHSPDPDDAFMFYALASGAIDTGPYRFVHELGDIETLNRRARARELELTALSFAAYPHLAADYQLLSCGASVGSGYGPLLVGRSREIALEGATIAIPGLTTTAALALHLFAAQAAPGIELKTRVVPFDRIAEMVASGDADLGLLIHEGQLTYRRDGLEAVVDLGRWWGEETGLPLPLGGNAVRRDLGVQVIADLADLLKSSIEFALAHRPAALAHAGAFGRGLKPAETDRFVGMYVNEWTIDLGERGRRAVGLLLERGHAAGLVPAVRELDFAVPGGGRLGSDMEPPPAREEVER